MTRAQTELLAIVCAALVPAIALSLLLVFGDRTVEPSLGSIFAWACLILLVSAPITVVVWCSAVLCLDRFGWVNAVTSLAAGGLIGALASSAFTYPNIDVSSGFLLWSGIGMLSGLVFWRIRTLPAK